MKFDSVELERIVERSLQDPPQWRPASHKYVRAAEAVVFCSVLGYWLFGLVSLVM
jgi:hypothetical protein